MKKILKLILKLLYVNIKHQCCEEIVRAMLVKATLSLGTVHNDVTEAGIGVIEQGNSNHFGAPS